MDNILLLQFLDWLLHALHFTVIICNLCLWWFLRTLRISQIGLILTVLSWLGLGYFYGWGYCILTDWQWQVKQRLGETNLPNSYITYILHAWDITAISPQRVDQIVAGLLVVSVLGCLIQTFRKKSGSITNAT